MPNILTYLLITILFFVAYQDLKKRTIHIILPVTVFFLAVLINYFSIDLNFNVIIYNASFILINILGLTAYFSFKAKKIINPIDSSIGLGDIVFFLALTPLFNLKPFILFFILGLLFALIVHTLFILFKKVKTIPLAGYLSLFLILNLIAKNIFKINFLF